MPCSLLIHLANSSRLWSKIYLNLSRTLALLSGGWLDHSFQADFEFSTAWLTSSTDAKSTFFSEVPVAGLNTGLFKPDLPSTLFPLM